MNFVRKSVLVLITPLFTLFLFATALDMGVLRTVNDPANVKKVLSDSGIYNTAVNSLLSQAKQVTSNDGSVSLNNSIIKTAANGTFTPQYLQQNTDSVIDSIYAWLNGKTSQPDFSIDVTSLKSKFATQVGKAVEQQAASLPTCPAGTDLSSFDPVSATCLPPGVTPAAAASQATGDIISGQGFLDHPVINADSIKSQGSDQSVFTAKKQIKDLPKQYQKIKKTPIILSLLALLTAAAIVFLNTSRRKGLRHIGVVLLLIGLFMLVFAWGLNYGVTQKAVPNIKLNNAVVQTDVRKVVTDLTQKIDQNYWIFGSVYAALGILAVGAAMFWGKGGSQPMPAKAPTAGSKPDSETKAATPAAKPNVAKSTKKTIKVQ